MALVVAAGPAGQGKQAIERRLELTPLKGPRVPLQSQVEQRLALGVVVQRVECQMPAWMASSKSCTE